MPFHLIFIRSYQLKRLVKELGIYSFLVTGAIIFFIYASWLKFQQNTGAYIIPGSLFLFCLYIQSIRNDIPFVYRHLERPYTEIYLEYSVLVFPFMATSLFSYSWPYFFLLYLALGLLPFYRPVFRASTRFKNISRFFQEKDFEWISGFRKYYYILFPLYLISIIFSWVKILPLFLLWFLTTVIASFYEEHEPLHILRANDLKANEILRGKSVRHASYQLIAYIPIVIAATFFHPGLWHLHLAFLFSQMILLYFFIVFKYSCYEPATINKTSNLITGLVSLASLIPFFLPVPLLMAVIYRKKALQRIKEFLYDNN